MYERIARPARPAPTTDFDGSTKARLLAVAAKAFATDGYERVTIRRVAETARVNIAAVNYHFGSKAGLYRVVVEGALAHLQGALRDVRSSTSSPREIADAIVAAFVGPPDTMETGYVLARLIAWEIVRAPVDRPTDEPSTVDIISRALADQLPARWSNEDRATAARWLIGHCLLGTPPTPGVETSERDLLVLLTSAGLGALEADPPTTAADRP